MSFKFIIRFSFSQCLENDSTTKADLLTAQNPCHLDFDQGLGDIESGSERWYYNKNSKVCKIFMYYGIGGNDNNFSSYMTCMGVCEIKPPVPKTTPKPPGSSDEGAKTDLKQAGGTTADTLKKVKALNTLINGT